MSRLSLLLGLAAGASLSACAPDATIPTEQTATPPTIQPIVNGEPDGTDGTAHPSVGALLDYDFDGDGMFGVDDLLCSGTYVGPDLSGTYGVFLTAAHCLAVPGIADLYVTFQGAPDVNGHYATAIPVHHTAVHPRFSWKQSDPGDLALAFLEIGSVPGGLTPAALPAAGYLDTANRKNGLKGAEFENVGYGLAAFFKGHHPSYGGAGTRRESRSVFMALRKAWLGLLMNTDATGLGGDCYGDSGGPKFVPGQNLMVAITVTGDAICRATSWDYRLDTPGARAFLSDHLALP